MKFGAHLPLIGFDDRPWTLDRMASYARTAARLRYVTLAANDHLVFPKPWFDGPTALAVALPHAGEMTLMTSVALPVVRGPAALAKTLGALDALSGGRVIAGVGPGSSARDYALVGVSFEERWPRFEESVRAMRALWSGDGSAHAGAFYDTTGFRLDPPPARDGGPPIWIGSWGSGAGMRRVARLADGWLASAYNATPATFAEAKAALDAELARRGKDPATFPNALATTFMYVTEDAGEARRIIEQVIAPTINRPPEQLAERLLVGSAAACAEKVAAYETAGLRQVLVWPVADEERQLEIFRERVASR